MYSQLSQVGDELDEAAFDEFDAWETRASAPVGETGGQQVQEQREQQEGGTDGSALFFSKFTAPQDGHPGMVAHLSVSACAKMCCRMNRVFCAGEEKALFEATQKLLLGEEVETQLDRSLDNARSGPSSGGADASLGGGVVDLPSILSPGLFSQKVRFAGHPSPRLLCDRPVRSLCDNRQGLESLIITCAPAS